MQYAYNIFRNRVDVEGTFLICNWTAMKGHRQRSKMKTAK